MKEHLQKNSFDRELFASAVGRVCRKFKVTVQFGRCFRLIEHISIISRHIPINLFSICLTSK